jgi:hypothetical protein
MKSKEEIERLAESQYGTEIGSIRGSNPYDLEGDRKNGFIQGYKTCQEDTAKLYSEIENLIITWSIDGTKTAGTLTRQIMKTLE